MKRLVVAALTALLMASLVLPGCTVAQTAGESGADPSPQTVTDLAGREVEVPESVERVVAIGSGALRLVVYAGGADKVVGIEEIESKPPISRPYILANPHLLELPVIGVGGPDSAPDAERILGVDADVIFVAQLADANAADELAAKTGVPVYVLSYGDVGTFGEPLFESIGVVGQVLDTRERAEEVSAYLRDTMADLSARTADVDDADKATAFVGALGYKGLHGLESTQAEYPPFETINALNVAEGLGSGTFMIDKEQLVEWDPDCLFVDRSGLGLVLQDVAVNRPLYESMTAVAQGRVYGQLPFNNYWTNVEIALADAYYAGSVLFPGQFADVDPAAKADELATFLVGGPVYDALVEVHGGGFGPVDLLGE